MNWRAWRDFFVTLILLGLAFALAVLSSVAAEQDDIKHATLAAAVSLLLALLGALYIIPKLARNIRLEILRFAVRTTVTVEGLLFIVFLAIVGFAAWNTGNNLLYLILSAMLAFLIAANLMARLSIADVSVQLRFPDHIFAGEAANLTVTLVNHKHVTPSYSLTVEALADDDSGPVGQGGLGKLAYFVLAPARASARQKIEYTFERRGRYPINGFRVSTKFPASFFKKWRRIDAKGELLVYPKPRPIDDFYHALPMLAGRMDSHARGSGDDLYAIRRYQQSDHMRHIDWKATAKSMAMMVREHTREDEWRLTIVFDAARPESAESEGWDSFATRFESAVVMAASLASHFITERADVELITQDDKRNIGPGSGYDHLYKILRSLATLEPSYGPKSDSEQLECKRPRRRKPAPARRQQQENETSRTSAAVSWRLLDELPVLADERRFKVLITSAAKGTIPANVWRSAHVVFMEDL
jgi:uncharacterized protein (DUF58 family)